MKHVRMIPGSEHDGDGDDPGKVHFDDPNGLHTLCGWCDTGRWETTTKPVNCDSCLRVQEHVLAHSPAKR